jgi:hypothetical protein
MLTAANSNFGATMIEAGRLALAGAGAIDAMLSLNVGADGMFDVSGKAGSYVYGGTVDNQGAVMGGLGPNMFEMSGDVSGAGDYLGNILFTGNVSPGNSPALVTMGNATFGAGSVLTMELGGLLRGTEHDAIVAESLSFDPLSTVKIELIGLGGPTFMPMLGNFFDVFTARLPFVMNAQLDFTGAALTDGLLWSTMMLVGNEGSSIFRVLVIAGAETGGDVPGPAAAVDTAKTTMAIFICNI